MNKLAFPILLTFTVAMGAFAIHEYRQAEHFRALAAQMDKDAAGAREESDTHTSEIRKLTEQARSQKVAIEQLETRNKELANGAPAGAAKPAATDSEVGTDEGGGFMKGLAKMFSDPKMKDAMRAQQAAGINMMYADLAKEVGLAPDEARQVLALLADRQMEMTGKSMAAMSKTGLDAKALEAAGKETEAAKSVYDEQIKAVVGDQRYAKFKDYENSMGERVVLDQIQKQLSAGGTPLEAGQTTGLLAIMKEERAKVPNPAAAGNPSAQMKMMQSEDGMNAYVKTQEEFNRRVLDRARTVLSPDQMLTFEAAQKQQIEMQRMGLEMSKQMFKGKK